MSKINPFENIFVDNEIGNVSPQFKITHIGPTQLDNDPLEGVAKESSALNLYRLNQVVFAEAIDVLQSSECNKDNFSNDDIIDDSFLPETFEDKPHLETNVGKKKRGRKKKYPSAEEDKRSHRCPESSCSRQFPTQKRAVEHHHKIHVLERDRFPCNVCSRAFPERYLLARHSAVHERAKRECPVCHKMISVRSSLKLHIRSHSGEKSFTCLLCGQGFTRQSGLTTHRQFIHKKDGLKCSHCSTSFGRRIELTRHLQSVHASQPTVECHLCGCRFTTLAALGAHRTKRHDVYTNVTVQVRNMKDGRNSESHKLSEKSINNETKSDSCNPEQSAPSVVKQTKHTIITEINNAVEICICIICEAEYSTRWHLIQHIRTHINNDDSTFTCQICNEDMEGGENARTHFDTIHSGTPMLQSDHRCTECRRTFRRKDQLTRHMAIHIGEKNWQCEFCPSGFLRRGQLTRHHARVHNQQLKVDSGKKRFKIS